jgi:hypothetical protein
MHFPIPNANCLDDTGRDLLDDFEPMFRDRCNTWPMRHPTEVQANDPFLIDENM